MRIKSISYFILACGVVLCAGVASAQSSGDCRNKVDGQCVSVIPPECQSIKDDVAKFNKAYDNFMASCGIGSESQCIDTAQKCNQCSSAAPDKAGLCGDNNDDNSDDSNNVSKGSSAAKIQYAKVCPQLAGGNLQQYKDDRDRIEREIKDYESKLDNKKQDLQNAEIDLQKAQTKFKKSLSDEQACHSYVMQGNKNTAAPANCPDGMKPLNVLQTEETDTITKQLQQDSNAMQQVALKEVQMQNDRSTALDQARQYCYDQAYKQYLAYMKLRRAQINAAQLAAPSLAALFNGAGVSQQQKNMDKANGFYQQCLSGMDYYDKVLAIERGYQSAYQAEEAIRQSVMKDVTQQQAKLAQVQPDINQAMIAENQRDQKAQQDAYAEYQSANSQASAKIDQLMGVPGNSKPQNMAAIAKKLLIKQAEQAGGSFKQSEADMNGQNYSDPYGKPDEKSEIGELEIKIAADKKTLDTLESLISSTSEIPDPAVAQKFRQYTSDFGSSAVDVAGFCDGEKVKENSACKNVGAYINDGICLRAHNVMTSFDDHNLLQDLSGSVDTRAGGGGDVNIPPGKGS